MYDPLILAQLDSSEDVDINSYLVCLAAYQRGLSVTYHRTLLRQQFLIQSNAGYKAELFSISDGKTRHYFDRTIGDRTTPEAASNSKDKHKTKAILDATGILVPKGIVIYRNQTDLLKKFLNKNRSMRFVVKPFNGSLSKGLHRNLDFNDVTSIVESHTDERLIVEEYIVGDEYRIYVSGERAVGAYKREPPSVTGSGGKSIEELIVESNILRKKNPIFKDTLIKIDNFLIANLMQNGLTLKDRLADGRKVILYDTRQRREGAFNLNATETVPEKAKDCSVSASKALKIPNCGVDIIVSKFDGKPYILEINTRAGIAPHTYPLYGEGQGNAIAEAIIDLYFPQSVHNKRFPNSIIHIYNVINALKMGAVSDVTLPTLGLDWVQHRGKIDSAFDQSVLKNIKLYMLHHGLYGQIFTDDQNHSYLDVCGPKAACDRFIQLCTATR